MKLIIPFFVLAALAPAQIVSVGVKAGVPVTDALSYYEFNGTAVLDTGRWTVGPTIEFHLFAGLSVEADALYRGYRDQWNFAQAEIIAPGATGPVTFPAMFGTYLSSAKVWDFPLLLKYRFNARRYRPFVTAGATLSHASFDSTASQSCLSSASVCANSPYGASYNTTSRYSSSQNTFGPTAGAGVEFKVGKFKLAPEVRYTHMDNPRRNLVTVMVGFTY
jgi:hypothetical protein